MSHFPPLIVTIYITIKGGFFMKKTVVVLLLIIGLGSISTISVLYSRYVMIGNTTIQHRYSAILSCRENIIKKGNCITANASFSSQIPTSLHMQMNLQQNIDNKWRTVKTWNKSSSKSSGLADFQSYPDYSGYPYRLSTQFTAGSETISLISY